MFQKEVGIPKSKPTKLFQRPGSVTILKLEYTRINKADKPTTWSEYSVQIHITQSSTIYYKMMKRDINCWNFNKYHWKFIKRSLLLDQIQNNFFIQMFPKFDIQTVQIASPVS